MLLILVVSLCAVAFGRKGKGLDPFGDAGDFEEYELSMSCAPSWCGNPSNRAHAGDVECNGNYGLILHGLWPNYNPPRQNHGWPQFCPSAYNPSTTELQHILHGISDWTTIAPEYGQLIDHEWERHGTCSGLAPQAYFELAFNLARERVVDQCSDDQTFISANSAASPPSDTDGDL